MNRFNALTGFRCVAACMVFVFHNRKYWRDYLPAEIERLLNEFHIGVALFFVLSGFLIAYTYASEPMRSGRAYARYMLLRLARIMPLYWLIITVYYLDAAYGKGHATWLTYSLAHGFSNTDNLNGIAQAWSLTVEMTFYLLAPLLCLLQRRHLLYLIGALVLLFAISWEAGEIWKRANGNPRQFFYPLSFIATGVFSGRSTEFLAGMLLAAALRNAQSNWLQQLRHKTWYGFLGIVLTAYVSGLFQQTTYEQATDHTGGMLLQKIVLPFFTIIALAGLMYERTWVQRFLASKLMVLLGNASFAFYLVHFSYVNMKMKDYFLLPDRNFTALWLVAIVLYLVFEKPVYNFCRKRLKTLVVNS